MGIKLPRQHILPQSHFMITKKLAFITIIPRGIFLIEILVVIYKLLMQTLTKVNHIICRDLFFILEFLNEILWGVELSSLVNGLSVLLNCVLCFVFWSFISFSFLYCKHVLQRWLMLHRSEGFIFLFLPDQFHRNTLWNPSPTRYSYSIHW